MFKKIVYLYKKCLNYFENIKIEKLKKILKNVTKSAKNLQKNVKNEKF